MNMTRKEAMRKEAIKRLKSLEGHGTSIDQKYLEAIGFAISDMQSFDQPTSEGEQIARECEAARDAADKIWTLKLWLLPDSELPAHQAADLILEAMRRKGK
jgi:hypothetical protein